MQTHSHLCQIHPHVEVIEEVSLLRFRKAAAIIQVLETAAPVFET